MGDGTLMDKNIPSKIRTAANWNLFSAGYTPAKAVKNSGNLIIFGSDDMVKLEIIQPTLDL